MRADNRSLSQIPERAAESCEMVAIMTEEVVQRLGMALSGKSDCELSRQLSPCRVLLIPIVANDEQLGFSSHEVKQWADPDPGTLFVFTPKICHFRDSVQATQEDTVMLNDSIGLSCDEMIAPLYLSMPVYEIHCLSRVGREIPLLDAELSQAFVYDLNRRGVFGQF